MVKLAVVRRLALALPEATEADHHGMSSFRVQGKIFATVPDSGHLHVMLDQDLTDAAVAIAPNAFEELWWGKQRCGIRVDLGRADEQILADFLEEAWRRKAPRRLIKASAAATVPGRTR